MQTTEDARLVVIHSIDDGTTIGAARVGDAKLRTVRWADDAHVLLTTASTLMPFELQGEKTEWHLIQVFDVQRRKIRRLLENVHGTANSMNVVYGRPVVRVTTRGPAVRARLL